MTMTSYLGMHSHAVSDLNWRFLEATAIYTSEYSHMFIFFGVVVKSNRGLSVSIVQYINS